MAVFTYFILDLAVFLIPFLFSFEKQISFYRLWKPVWLSILVTAIFFIVWDSFFTVRGVWLFNPKYLVGVYLLHLPVEEILFFIAIPYACLFIYKVGDFYFGRKLHTTRFNFLFLIVAFAHFCFALFHLQEIYTSITYTLLSVLLIVLIAANVDWLPLAFSAYLIQLVPFLIINGILTSLPVVIYNINFNQGIKFLTIPMEDFSYSALILLITFTLFEWLAPKTGKLLPIDLILKL